MKKFPLFFSLPVLFLALGSPSVRAQDAGPSVPAGDGSQVLWLAADFGVGTAVGSNQVTSWFDASNNGHNWLSGSGGSESGGPPGAYGNDQILTTGNTEPAGNPANNVPLVSFLGIVNGGIILDHTNDALSLTSFSIYMVVDSERQAGDGTLQCFLDVFNTDAQNGNGYAVGTADGSPTNAKFYTGSSLTNINLTNGSFTTGQYNFLGATIDSSGNKSLTAGAYDGPDTQTITGAGISPDGGEYVMGNLSGGSQPFLGNVAEMLIYDDSNLTDAQITDQQTAVTAYLDNKYFTAVPEPASFGLLACGALGLLAQRRRRV